MAPGGWTSRRCCADDTIDVDIIVKATADRVDDIDTTVTERVREVLGTAARVTVSRVFPDVTRGNRARLLLVRLPDELAAPDVTSVLEHLRSAEGVEYAEVPSPKKPMTEP